jgi:betaine-aldehyde dehydrogenase
MEKLTNFINGKAVDSKSGETTSLINPSTGQAYANAPKSNAADVDSAFKAASDAFPGWRDSTPSQRQRALLKIADAIESRADEIIEIETTNTGKPISLTTTEEVPPMVDLREILKENQPANTCPE